MYQNQWHLSKLTKKQKKLSQYKVKVFSTELGRSVFKHRMLKTIHPTWIQKTKKYEANSKRVSPQAKGHIMNNNNTVAIQHNNQYSGLNAKKVLRRMVKRWWFFNTAAPIPGVTSLKKRKRLQSTKLRAFKTIQSWLGIYNKKQMKALFGMQKSTWKAILMMESIFQSCFRKRAFTYNAQQRNALASSKLTTINGSFVEKLRFANIMADLSITKKIPNEIQRFYAVKKLAKTKPQTSLWFSSKKNYNKKRWQKPTKNTGPKNRFTFFF